MNTHPSHLTLSSLLLSSFPSLLCLCCTQFSSAFLPLLLLEESLTLWQLRCSLSRSVVFTKRGKMNCYYQQNNTLTSCEEMRMESMVCPKPRRMNLLNHSSMNNHIRPLRRPMSYQCEIEDSGVGAELLDIILPKDSCYPESDRSWESPFFCGSPPSRASNPVIQDEQFGNGNFSPFAVASSSPSSSSARGCVPMKFGNTPAAVRVEGFDCLSRDRRSNRSISAVA